MTDCDGLYPEDEQHNLFTAICREYGRAVPSRRVRVSFVDTWAESLHEASIITSHTRHHLSAHHNHTERQPTIHDDIHIHFISLQTGIICLLPFPCRPHALSHDSVTFDPFMPLFLARRLLRMLSQRVSGVAAQSTLCVVARLLRALGRCAALVVDIASVLAGLGVGLPLGLGGLAASVGSRHDVYVKVCIN
jgi:hypothetical protein